MLLAFAAAVMLVHTGYAVPPTLQFSGQPLSPNQTQIDGPPLTITCLQPAVAGTTMVSMYLRKIPRTGGDERELVAVDINNKVPEVAAGMTGIMTAEGHLDSRNITVTITHMGCHDSGEYICESNYLSVGDAIMEKVSENYTVEVSPGMAELLYISLDIPSGSGAAHGVGDLIKLTCGADVGTVNDNTQIHFVWEYEIQGFNGKTFIQYPTPKDIEDDPDHTTSPNTCGMQTRKSYLVRNMTVEDHERQYKCYITKDDTSYEDQAAFYTLPMVEDTVGIPASTASREGAAPGNGVSVVDKRGSTGAIVRGGVATVTILAIIAAVVVV